MDKIIIKSGVNWCKHILSPLLPLNSKLHPNEKVYKLVTDYRFTTIKDDNKVPIGIVLGCGPTLEVGHTNENIGMQLKEITTAFNKDTGESLFTVLIFEP